MKNESNLDRIIRVLLALLFIVVGTVVFVGSLSIVAYILAVTMLVTAVTGFCPLYKLLGIDTNSKK